MGRPVAALAAGELPTAAAVARWVARWTPRTSSTSRSRPGRRFKRRLGGADGQAVAKVLDGRFTTKRVRRLPQLDTPDPARSWLGRHVWADLCHLYRLGQSSSTPASRSCSTREATTRPTLSTRTSSSTGPTSSRSSSRRQRPAPATATRQHSRPAQSASACVARLWQIRVTVRSRPPCEFVLIRSRRALLQEPVAPRMTKCGHVRPMPGTRLALRRTSSADRPTLLSQVYCYSCVLQYLALAESKSARCPIWSVSSGAQPSSSPGDSETNGFVAPPLLPAMTRSTSRTSSRSVPFLLSRHSSRWSRHQARVVPSPRPPPRRRRRHTCSARQRSCRVSSCVSSSDRTARRWPCHSRQRGPQRLSHRTRRPSTFCRT